ncbi:hypothetical protein SAMN05428995_103407 [Loktanella sp. DSM 29012]|uniref:hypothetical protein n=1 Tax=Loktanella sp. DSM 29012 TaxID=1881056 RepID=UPI0008D7B791|nr:hypothetical protein [Loktanella sp. DSM 29012]SEQ26638.1 hypothetical protein SAMN05428995_103407 [Loktanella sp. DSM 29012]
MPLQNRVLPTQEIVADPARGTLTGNRGILHIADGVMGRARWKSKAWICCTLDWQGRRRQLMTGRKWTELFLLDEATALAAGHRPCAYCRRADYNRYRDAWATATGDNLRAPQMDNALHTARIDPATRGQARMNGALASLPDGTMIVTGGQPHLIWQDALWPYTPAGYQAPRSKKGAEVIILTPAPHLEILRAGYAPALHHTLMTPI